MEIIFPDHYYFHYHAPNADEFMERLNGCGTWMISNSDFPWVRDCDVDVIRLEWEKWYNFLTPSLQLLSKDISDKIGIDNIEYSLCDPWMNLYKKGGFQEIHDHKDADIASVFFLQNDDHFYFHNRNANLGTIWRQPDRQFMKVKKGDIIFFPAHMLHGVTPNRNETIRKTFSCNLWIRTQ